MGVQKMYASPISVELYRKGDWLDGVWYFTLAPFRCGVVAGPMIGDFWHLKRALQSGRYRLEMSDSMPLDPLQLEKCRDMGLVRAAAEPVESEA